MSKHVAKQSTLFRAWATQNTKKIDKGSTQTPSKKSTFVKALNKDGAAGTDPSESSKQGESHQDEHHDQEINVDLVENVEEFFADDIADQVLDVSELERHEQPCSSSTDKMRSLLDSSLYEEIPGFDVEAGKRYIYPTNFPVRDYQFNIVKKCLFKNTLVSLPTGLGKTFIAAVLMYNYYRWFPSKKIVFLAPTKPLVAQQIEACFGIMGRYQ